MIVREPIDLPDLSAMWDEANGTPCTHHWRLQSPNGARASAVCSKCGDEREFENAWRERARLTRTPEPVA